MIDFRIFDDKALDQARDGDFERLCSKIAYGTPLTDEEKEFIIGRVRGTQKLRRGTKPKLQPTDRLVAHAHVWLVEIERVPRDPAIRQIAESLQRYLGAERPENESNIYKRLRRFDRLNIPLVLEAKKQIWQLACDERNAGILSETEFEKIKPEILRRDPPIK